MVQERATSIRICGPWLVTKCKKGWRWKQTQVFIAVEVTFHLPNYYISWNSPLFLPAGSVTRVCWQMTGWQVVSISHMFVLAGLRPVWKLSSVVFFFSYFFFLFFWLIVRISWEFSGIFNAFRTAFFFFSPCTGCWACLASQLPDTREAAEELNTSLSGRGLESSASAAPGGAGSSGVFSLQILQMKSLTFRDKVGPGENRVTCQRSNLTGTETCWRTSRVPWDTCKTQGAEHMHRRSGLGVNHFLQCFHIFKVILRQKQP